MYEFASTTMTVLPRREGYTIADVALNGTHSMLLDLGEGLHVLAGEIVAIQALAEAMDFRRHFRKAGDPCATVMLRGGQELTAFRSAEELRADWERSLLAFNPADRVAPADALRLA